LTSLAPYIAVAGALLVLGLALSACLEQPSISKTARRGALGLGLAMAVPACIMAGLLPLVWSPYYSCMPTLGFSVIAGVLLAGARSTLAGLVLVTYFALGIWSRTVGLEPIVSSESHLRSTGAALAKVERGFKALQTTLPEDAHAYVSAQVQGPDGVYLHLYRFQPLRIWYRGPSIFVLDPNRPQKGGGQDYLFWITKDYDVFEVDLNSYAPRGSGSAPDAFAYQKTLRTFALGRASVGSTDEAVRILLQMPDRPPHVQAYDRRTAAALLLAADRRRDAEHLLRGMPPFSRSDALDATFAILHEPVPGLALEDAVMEAFGLSPLDLEANRMLMQAFDQNGFSEPAIRFARRLAALAPNDPEPPAVLRKWSNRKSPIRISVPIPHS
jgi:hypothetical protein